MTNQINSTLIKYWQEILGIEVISMNDDFFELGGDSITVLQLVSKIKKDFNIQLNASSILNNPTITLLTELITRQSSVNISSTPVPNILCMQKGDIDQYLPLILIHAADGDVYIYSNLVHGMPDKYPIFAIRSPMIDNKKNFQSIEEMSEDYIEQLEKYGIRPPYIVGGSSFGGIVAYHMACSLYEKNKTISTVISIDAPSFNKLPHGFDEDIVILEYLGKYMFPKLQISIEELRKFNSTEEQINYIKKKANELGMNEAIPSEFNINYLNTWKAHQKIMNEYIANPYNGPMVFFSHTEVIPEFPTDQHLDWIKLVQGDFQHFRIPGNHSSMNSQPNIDSIIKHLSRVIEHTANKSLVNNEKGINI